MNRIETLTAQFLTHVRNTETAQAYAMLDELAQELAVYALNRAFEEAR